MQTFPSPDAVIAACADGPADLGRSDWWEITQERVDAFAEATGDHLWIHTDPARAAAESPFGGTIAHGYLTLSLCAAMVEEVFTVEGLSMAMNYGIDSLRFLAPVRTGKRARLAVTLNGTKQSRMGTQLLLRFTVEVEGEERPALVADVVYLIVPA